MSSYPVHRLTDSTSLRWRDALTRVQDINGQYLNLLGFVDVCPLGDRWETRFASQISMRYAVDDHSWTVLRNTGFGNTPSAAFCKFARYVMRDALRSEFHKRHFPSPYLVHEVQPSVQMPVRRVG